MHSGVLLCLFKVLPEAVDHAFAGNQIEGCSRKDLSGCQNRVMRLLAFTGIYKNRRESDKGIDTLGGADQGEYQHQQGDENFHPIAEFANDEFIFSYLPFTGYSCIISPYI